MLASRDRSELIWNPVTAFELHGCLINQQQPSRPAGPPACEEHRNVCKQTTHPLNFHSTSQGSCWLNPIFEIHASAPFDAKPSCATFFWVTFPLWIPVALYLSFGVYGSLLAGNVVLVEPCEARVKLALASELKWNIPCLHLLAVGIGEWGLAVSEPPSTLCMPQIAAFLSPFPI